MREVLTSLRDGRELSAAAGALWRVAAPKFQRSLGTPEHLAHLFTNPLWTLLREAAHYELESTEQVADAARVHVALRGEAGEPLTTFVFTLRATGKDGGDGAASWSITGVAPANRLDL